MFNIIQFRDLIIKSSLNDLLLYSKEAEELIVFTCATESLGGTYLSQVGGPALGIYQMEPVTYNDIWQSYISQNPRIMLRLVSAFNCNRMPPEELLIYDLRFATAMTRLFYARIKEPLPSADDVEAIWDYYKQYYNTYKGEAAKDISIKRYRDFVQCHR
jgi:hypothetical protein